MKKWNNKPGLGRRGGPSEKEKEQNLLWAEGALFCLSHASVTPLIGQIDVKLLFDVLLNYTRV